MSMVKSKRMPPASLATSTASTSWDCGEGLAVRTTSVSKDCWPRLAKLSKLSCCEVVTSYYTTVEFLEVHHARNGPRVHGFLSTSKIVWIYSNSWLAQHGTDPNQGFVGHQLPVPPAILQEFEEGPQVAWQKLLGFFASCGDMCKNGSCTVAKKKKPWLLVTNTLAWRRFLLLGPAAKAGLAAFGGETSNFTKDQKVENTNHIWHSFGLFTQMDVCVNKLI